MVGRVGQRAQGAGDSGHVAVADAVELEQGGALGDGHLVDGDLLDPSLLGQAGVQGGAQVARPVALAAVGTR